jgi:hypothetical protein
MARKFRTFAADCETDPFKAGRVSKPFIWGCYDIYSREYLTFGSAELFVAWVREIQCTVYFHNGGKFDAHYLRPFFDSDQEIKIINGRIASFRIGKAEFRDSYNIIPVPLARFAKEKIDYSIMEADVRDLPANVALIESYLKSDCVNLGTLLLAYLTRYGKGLTQAGAAMNYWSKHYNGGKKPKQTAAQFERYRPYYYGGRVECFVSGYAEKRFTVVDRNSAYPDAMCRRHPISPEAISLSKLPSETLIPQCLIRIRAVSRGAFPFRLPSGELTFPRNNTPRVYDITGWELQAAQELNAVDIREVLAVNFFRETVTFDEYIHYFYLERKAAKCNGDKAGDIFAKLFMNSCYGKFASNPENYHEYMLSSLERMAEHVANGYADYHPWGDSRRLLWRKLPVDRHNYYNIATAASITGFPRAGLYTDLCRVQDPLYCDTDSIAAVDVSRLSLGPELGQWKIELECDAYAILGKKTYAFRSAFDQQWNKEEERFEYPKGSWKVACKGVRLSALQIVALAKGEDLPRDEDGNPYLLFRPEVPTYTITRPEPRFINRKVRVTANIQIGSLHSTQ